ncbi:MAG: ATP-binding protein [Gluconobacter cerinus]|uniref:ATP-binding protein n=1 Tax=Gluconobacter cerinus TaxID=38307 RepID=UPI001B8C746A|nr:ATP-binding protein [Gluconobacter cerinus]MBS1023839.1 HAMP domain-containing protein [Gluconobacter cerinus]MBS1044769.1 HAMP domain-containing protein [Gluconobacter cerinus]
MWPLGLVGRVCVVLTVAVTLVFLANAVFYGEAETYIVDDVRIAQLGEALSTDLRVLAAAPVTQRSFLAVMLSGSELSVAWQPSTALPHLPGYRPTVLRDLTARLIKDDPILAQAQLDLYTLGTGTPDVLGSERLPDGTYIHFRVPGLLGHHHFTRGLASAAIAAGAVAIAATMLIRGLSMPLRALASVADKIGSNETWVPLAERGPREVRGVARAINAMQRRIQSLINDRTQALAAVSHDLRTPLTRLRLRCGFLNDGEAQAAIESDLDEMEGMVNGILAYLAGADDPEKPRTINIVATLATLVDDHADHGKDARYEGPDRALVHVRPLAIKRVLSNLIENALNYGGNALATLRIQEDGAIEISIQDNGPGIPESEYERVLAPFYRLEGSRSRQTGGIGLGLAIVTREIAREGGYLKLGRGDAEKGYGGLCATIVLPPARKPSIGARPQS